MPESILDSKPILIKKPQTYQNHFGIIVDSPKSESKYTFCKILAYALCFEICRGWWLYLSTRATLVGWHGNKLV